jgi:hypothetical protein
MRPKIHLTEKVPFIKKYDKDNNQNWGQLLKCLTEIGFIITMTGPSEADMFNGEKYIFTASIDGGNIKNTKNGEVISSKNCRGGTILETYQSFMWAIQEFANTHLFMSLNNKKGDHYYKIEYSLESVLIKEQK